LLPFSGVDSVEILDVFFSVFFSPLIQEKDLILERSPTDLTSEEEALEGDLNFMRVKEAKSYTIFSAGMFFFMKTIDLLL
jgi:hypothetical protein